MQIKNDLFIFILDKKIFVYLMLNDVNCNYISKIMEYTYLLGSELSFNNLNV